MTTYSPNDLMSLATRPLDGVIEGWDAEEVVELYLQLNDITVLLGAFRRQLREELAGSLGDSVIVGHRSVKPTRKATLSGTPATIKAAVLAKTRHQFVNTESGEPAWAVHEDDVGQFWSPRITAVRTIERELGLPVEWSMGVEVTTL